jgi:hypothetical protein
MRCDVRAGLSWGLIALALSLTGCTPAICGRNSDCAVGQVCTPAGSCGVPADAGGDGLTTDGGLTTDDGPTSTADAGSTP